jgi:pimeloyl-ACP methyl ester carboxylesterase
MPFLDTGNVRLFFTDEGDGGPPLLFVHGYTADCHDWSWQTAHFTSSHRAICADLRGHGRSSAPQTGYTTAQFAADLIALLDHLEVPLVVAFGHSMGGSVVSTLAVEYPDRVKAIVAVDPAYLLPDDIASGIQPLLDLIADSDPVPYICQIVGGLDAATTDPGLHAWHVRRAAGVEPHVLRQALESQALGMALHSVSAPYFQRRQVPVLSVYADPARVAVEQAVVVDERSRIVAWEGVGHWLHQERPEDFNRLVSDWLASVT